MSIAALQLHREKLANSKTFEEFRDYQLAYIDYLIETFQAKEIAKAAAEKFAAYCEPEQTNDQP